jgi:cardiolipin synthase
MVGYKSFVSRFTLIACVLLCVGAHANGDELFENSEGSPIFSLIQSARQSIQLEIYTMTDSRVKQEIRNAVDRGVKVDVIEESSPVGATCKVFQAAKATDTSECSAEKSLLAYVKSHGGSYVPFPKSLCGNPDSKCFQHGKMALIDQTTAVLGTGNMDSTSLCDATDSPSSCDRDFTVTTTDASILKSLSTVFNNDLQAASTSNLANLNSRLTISPDSMNPIIEFISSAKTSLLVENQYLEDPTMNAAIIADAKRGVKVTVLVSSACSFGTPTPSAVKKWNKNFAAFDSAGIKTWIFTGRIRVGGQAGYLHAKTMVADGARAWVGSINGSTTSLTNNREYGIFMNDAASVAKLKASIQADARNPLGESWQDSIQCKYDKVIIGNIYE